MNLARLTRSLLALYAHRIHACPLSQGTHSAVHSEYAYRNRSCLRMLQDFRDSMVCGACPRSCHTTGAVLPALCVPLGCHGLYQFDHRPTWYVASLLSRAGLPVSTMRVLPLQLHNRCTVMAPAACLAHILAAHSSKLNSYISITLRLSDSGQTLVPHSIHMCIRVTAGAPQRMRATAGAWRYH